MQLGSADLTAIWRNNERSAVRIVLSTRYSFWEVPDLPSMESCGAEAGESAALVFGSPIFPGDQLRTPPQFSLSEKDQEIDGVTCWTGHGDGHV